MSLHKRESSNCLGSSRWEAYFGWRLDKISGNALSCYKIILHICIYVCVAYGSPPVPRHRFLFVYFYERVNVGKTICSLKVHYLKECEYGHT